MNSFITHTFAEIFASVQTAMKIPSLIENVEDQYYYLNEKEFAQLCKICENKFIPASTYYHTETTKSIRWEFSQCSPIVEVIHVYQ